MADRAAEMGERQPRLPEIKMKWTDFVWSLEKLRHKSYNKSMRERYVLQSVALQNNEKSCESKKKKKKKCRNPGLNQGPLDLQSNALPTELFRHLLHNCP